MIELLRAADEVPEGFQRFEIELQSCPAPMMHTSGHTFSSILLVRNGMSCPDKDLNLAAVAGDLMNSVMARIGVRWDWLAAYVRQAILVLTEGA